MHLESLFEIYVIDKKEAKSVISKLAIQKALKIRLKKQGHNEEDLNALEACVRSCLLPLFHESFFSLHPLNV
jgi:hypothetical protein